jgi:hypothetical protein
MCDSELRGRLGSDRRIGFNAMYVPRARPSRDPDPETPNRYGRCLTRTCLPLAVGRRGPQWTAPCADSAPFRFT